MNTNWNPYYRRIYTYSGTLPKGTYRFCFSARNLPNCSPWNANPFGYVAYSTLSSTLPTYIGYWSLNVLNLTGCSWKQVVSEQFIGTGTPSNISVMLYNGWYADGNDLVIDNIRIVQLMAQPPLSFLCSLGKYNGFTYSFMASSATLPPSDCVDYWYLYMGGTLMSQGVATPSTGVEIKIKGFMVNVKYTLQIKRVCDCSTDAYWSTTFIVYSSGMMSGQAEVGKLILDKTNTNTFTVGTADNST